MIERSIAIDMATRETERARKEAHDAYKRGWNDAAWKFCPRCMKHQKNGGGCAGIPESCDLRM